MQALISAAQGRTWSEESCTCGCPLASITGCEAGQEFDYSGSCSCVPAPGHGKVSSKEPGEEMSEGEAVLGWEMVLIISLGSLLIILSTIGDTSHVTRTRNEWRILRVLLVAVPTCNRSLINHNRRI